MQLHRDAGGWTRDLARASRGASRRSRRWKSPGPARGHALMRTKADPDGARVFGTFANCAAGKTPWGTYLTSEENVDDYFCGRRARCASRQCGARSTPTAASRCARTVSTAGTSRIRASTCAHEPHEPLRFGWMVEIDPHDPESVPRKRTALGRFQHEGANTIVGKTGHVAAYMGDDEKFEYIYKFVTRDRFDPKNPGGESRPARSRHLVRRALRCGRHGRMAAAGARRERPAEFARGIRQPGRRGDQGARRRGLVRRHAHGSPRGCRAQPGHRPHLHRLHQVRGPRRHRGDDQLERPRASTSASTPRTRGPTTAPATSSRSPRDGDDATATRFKWNVFLLAGDPGEGRYIVDARDLARAGSAAQDTYFAGYRAIAPNSARCIAPTTSASTRRDACGS